MGDYPSDHLIHHYTNTTGLLGILNSKTLWATHVEFLNDAKELRYGRDDLCEALNKQANHLDAHPTIETENTQVGARAAIMRTAATILSEPVRSAADYLIYESRIYVTCFCREGDLLSQWRGYAAAGGYALGFDRSALEQGLSSHKEINVRLVQVSYGERAVEDMVPRTVRAIGEHASDHRGVAAYARVSNIALPALASVKHPAFEEEKEWRLIASIADGNVSHRIGAQAIIPYVPLPLTRDALREVRVGPGPNMDLRSRGLVSLLMEDDWDAEVFQSSAPFRG